MILTNKKPYKALNLYACLGGNRYKWDEVADIQVTAVELDPELAKLYQERFPKDEVIIADAHDFLLNNFQKFDFIWSSPPCPSHSKIRISQKNRPGFKYVFPDFKLYEEVVFLESFFKGKYVVENVIPYYQPLIPAQKRGRHLYWTNFNLPKDLGERKNGVGVIGSILDEVNVLSKFHDFDFRKYKGEQRLNKIARNLVDYEVGKNILKAAIASIEGNQSIQEGLFK